MIIKPYSCCNCGKEYKRYNFYTNHLINCTPETALKKKEDIKKPSSIEESILYLIKSNNELKKELEKIKEEKEKEIKKIELIPWLRENYKSDSNFKEFIENLEFDNKILESLLAKKEKELINEIIVTNLQAKRETKCLRCFNIKPNKIYIFTEIKEWKILGINDIKLLLNQINKKLREKLILNYNFENKLIDSEDYLKLVKKINNINSNNSAFCNTIYKSLFENLKENIKKIEYEFV